MNKISNLIVIKCTLLIYLIAEKCQDSKAFCKK